MLLFYVYKSGSKTLINKFQTLYRHSFRLTYSTQRRIIPTPDSSAFRTSFLENQCGLSGKSLIRASNLLNFEPSDERPISVLKLLQTFGFPQSNITKIISIIPRILLFDSQKILEPKLDLLVSITQSQTDVVRMVTTYPNILRSSLNNQIIPAFNLLHSVMGSYQDAAAVIKYKPNFLSESISKCVLPNIEFLLRLGVPSTQIVKLITTYGTVLGRRHDKFCEFVMKVKEMGFDLSSSYFIHAVRTLSFNTDASWESRCELFTSFGLSDDEILSMFKKYPAIMSYTEKRIRGILEFFVNKLGWSPSRLCANPAVLSRSLEKRVIPRCSVLQVLASKNITSKSFRLSTVLTMTEGNFLKNYVAEYKNGIPEIMDAYHGKFKFDVYTFKQK